MDKSSDEGLVRVASIANQGRCIVCAVGRDDEVMEP